MKNTSNAVRSIYILAMVIGLAIASAVLLRTLAYEWCVQNQSLFTAIVASVSMLPLLTLAFRERNTQ
jgi:hypothetical protein